MSDSENNVNDTTSVANLDESNMSDSETHSTQSASQNKIEINVTDQNLSLIHI